MRSFKLWMNDCAAFREKGGLRFLVNEMDGWVLFPCAVFVTVMLGLCGCSYRASAPVLESYQEEQEPGASTGREVSGDRDGQTAAAFFAKSGGGVQSSAALSPESDGAGQSSAALSSESDGSGQASAALSPESGGSVQSSAASIAESQGSGQAAQELGAAVTVHICGAVKKEGVYTLSEGSRVMDAVDAAGGFSDDADTEFLNLAAVLEDAWQIRVPTKEEAEALLGEGEEPAGSASSGNAPYGVISTGNDSSGNASYGIVSSGNASSRGVSYYGIATGTGGGQASPEKASSDKVNLNTADKSSLMRIPGVGESKAGSILEYREKYGGFDRIEDLMKVPGIKEASFEKMRDYISVE